MHTVVEHPKCCNSSPVLEMINQDPLGWAANGQPWYSRAVKKKNRCKCKLLIVSVYNFGCLLQFYRYGVAFFGGAVLQEVWLFDFTSLYLCKQHWKMRSVQVKMLLSVFTTNANPNIS